MSKKIVKDKIFKVKNDIVFKELFSKKGNEKFLIEFLSSLLHLDIQKIEIQKEVELKVEKVTEKLGAIDIKATINDNKIIDIEMQIENEYDIIERTTRYSSKLISNQLLAGQEYKNIKPVVIIVILDYSFLPYKDYINESITVLKNHKEFELNSYQKYYYI